MKNEWSGGNDNYFMCEISHTLHRLRLESCLHRAFVYIRWRLHHHDPRRSWARKNCNTYYECFTRSSSSSLYTQKWRVRNQNKSTRISYIFSFDGIYKRVGAAFRDFLLLSRPHICCLRRVSNEHEMKLCVYNFFSPSIHASILGSPLHQLSELARLHCFTFFYDTRLNLLWSIFFLRLLHRRCWKNISYEFIVWWWNFLSLKSEIALKIFHFKHKAASVVSLQRNIFVARELHLLFPPSSRIQMRLWRFFKSLEIVWMWFS